MEKKNKILIVVIISIAVVLGVIVMVLLRNEASYDSYLDHNAPVNNAADKALLDYNRNEKYYDTDIDMSNQDKTVDDINREYAESQDSGISLVDSINWSYIDYEWYADLMQLDDDEYGYISNYVLDLPVELFSKDTDIRLGGEYSELSFGYLSNGRNATYRVFYSVEMHVLAVYAFVQ